VITALVVAGILFCAVQAMRSARLLASALWLAGTSALVALLLYLLGAAEVAVIELSVGAGLVTILFVFAINIAGDEPLKPVVLVPRPLAWALVIGAVALLAWLNLPTLAAQAVPGSPALFTKVLWEERGLDTLLQLVIVFVGVLGVLALLAEGHLHAEKGKKQ
jgi:uncharacterized MnhB-related membrane protein